MKKTLKISALFMLVALMLLSLTGCGSDKIVATKSTDNSLAGKYSEQIEISFKDNKADKIVWSMEFEDEAKAQTMSGLYQMAKSKLTDMDIKVDGKKIVLTMGAASFASEAKVEGNDATKDKLVKSLEEKGYTIKK